MSDKTDESLRINYSELEIKIIPLKKQKL